MIGDFRLPIADCQSPDPGKSQIANQKSKILYRVTAMSGAEDGRDWWMEALPIRIGRHPDNDVYLAYDTRISRHHAEIIERFGQIYLRDLGSTNGTFLIGQRLQGSMPLPLGILFRVGSTMLRLTREARGE